MVRLFTETSLRLFPISTIDTLVNLFRKEFIQKEKKNNNNVEPNLALASILLGSLEHSLTSSAPISTTLTCKIPDQSPSQSIKKGGSGSSIKISDHYNNLAPADFPPIECGSLNGLYEKLRWTLRTGVNGDLLRSSLSTKVTSRELIKNISDLLWNSLDRAYMPDKPHLQSLFTYLTGRRLDSFGVALGVVAGCQVLGLNDVHLALSEDHAWVVFGSHGELSAQVTWHGKGPHAGDDRSGLGEVALEARSSWLYLKGRAVRCTRWMEIAAVVCAINPSIMGSSFDSTELATVQQKLLWELHKQGHLGKYPMALGNLADLEEISKMGSLSAPELYLEGIRSSHCHYGDLHVYPYTSYAAYLQRQGNHKLTLQYWARAANVISKYIHNSKEDEEIYREFFEITKDHLPALMKSSMGNNSCEPDYNLTGDPEAFADLLKFFDGICCWEESSPTPLLHIVWAKSWISAIGKFQYATARNKVNLQDSLTPSESVEFEPSLTVVKLRSRKMCGLKDLLVREKFNPAALTLHFTAQPHSNTGVQGQQKGSGLIDSSSRETRVVTGGRKRVPKLPGNGMITQVQRKPKRAKK